MNATVGYRPVITGQGRAVPSAVPQQEIWEEVFAPRLGGDRVARQIFLRAGITTRHACVDPRETDVSGWSTGDRMTRYVTAARGLGGRAVAAALAEAGRAPSDIGLFVVVSCTGYATPGLDILIADDLGMPASVRRLLVGHMGCYAAIPGLAAAADFVRAHGRPAVLLCVELPTLHLQRSDDPSDLQTVVSHALFADAAAAVVVEPDAPSGLELLHTTAATVPGTEALMTWDVTAHGFRMGLSPKVPDVLAGQVQEATRDLITPFGFGVGEVAGWAVHPGGRRIVDVVAERLHLSAEQVADSRRILDEYGNCSSPTVLMVLESIWRRSAASGPAGSGPAGSGSAGSGSAGSGRVRSGRARGGGVRSGRVRGDGCRLTVAGGGRSDRGDGLRSRPHPVQRPVPRGRLSRPDLFSGSTHERNVTGARAVSGRRVAGLCSPHREHPAGHPLRGAVHR